MTTKLNDKFASCVVLYHWDGEKESKQSTMTSSSQMSSIDFNLELDCLKGRNSDQQLAAKLGKSLLKENKEIRNTIKKQKNVIDELEQEIYFLRKNIDIQRRVNESRHSSYENLEMKCDNIEKTNKELSAELNKNKKMIKSLIDAYGELEEKCEELSENVTELEVQKVALQRNNAKLIAERNSNVRQQCVCDNCSPIRSIHLSANNKPDLVSSPYPNDEYTNVVRQLNATKRRFEELQIRENDLEEQLNALIQENQLLASRIPAKEVAYNLKSELSALDRAVFVSSETFCSRCTFNSTDDTDVTNSHKPKKSIKLNDMKKTHIGWFAVDPALPIMY